MAIASLWLSGGIMIDAWYHFHSTVETFFEPAHGLLYAGLLAAYVFTGIALLYGKRRGYSWRLALPAGYDVTQAGLLIALLGGFLDMIKHTLWGFEQGFNALMSPTHLMIGAGIFLVIAGPIRSGLIRPAPPRSLAAQLPLLFCAASMMELIHWGTQFIFQSEAERLNAPIPWYSMPHWTLTLLTLEYEKQAIGLLAVIVQSILITGFFVYLARRVRLSFGAIAVLFVVGNAFIAAAQLNFFGQFLAVIVSSLLAGIAADAFHLSPSDQTTRRWYLAGFCIPALYWAAMLGMLALTMGGIWWSPDVISGSVLFAGIAGLSVSALSGPFPARS
jgi:hypothetical protein